MLMHVFDVRSNDFWSNFSTLFESSSGFSNNLPVEGLDRNSTQLQLKFKEFSFKLMFWLTSFVAPLSRLSLTGNEYLSIQFALANLSHR